MTDREIKEQLQFDKESNESDYTPLFALLKKQKQEEVPDYFSKNVIAHIVKNERRENLYFLIYMSLGSFVFVISAFIGLYYFQLFELSNTIQNYIYWLCLGVIMVIFIQYFDRKILMYKWKSDVINRVEKPSLY